MMTEEEKYISRCIQLARNGEGHVAPNPMVGAVIVYKGRIIGEGYHARYGEAHAEANAIRSIKDKSLLKDSTIYVSLEPCAHYGKTPPCAKLIIEKQIPRVVIGCQDPFSKVAGRGIQMLREAGVEVKVGVMEQACKDLIKKFILFNTKKRPYITLKWAESADGYLDINRTDGKPVILSTALTTMLVHKKRAEADGIIVGTRTALLDNPSLTVRNWYGKNPTRIVIDKDLSLPSSLHLFQDNIPTLCFTQKEASGNNDVEYIQLDFQSDILPQMMTILYKKDIQSILIEGGSILLESFIKDNLWDEAYVEKSAVCLQDGVKAPYIDRKSICENERHFGVTICHYCQ